MSTCPVCKANLAQVDLDLGRCPSCQHRLLPEADHDHGYMAPDSVPAPDDGDIAKTLQAKTTPEDQIAATIAADPEYRREPTGGCGPSASDFAHPPSTGGRFAPTIDQTFFASAEAKTLQSLPPAERTKAFFAGGRARKLISKRLERDSRCRCTALRLRSVQENRRRFSTCQASRRKYFAGVCTISKWMRSISRLWPSKAKATSCDFCAGNRRVKSARACLTRCGMSGFESETSPAGPHSSQSLQGWSIFPVGLGPALDGGLPLLYLDSCAETSPGI